MTGGGVNLPGWCQTRFRFEPKSRPNWYVGDHFSLENRTVDEIKHVATMLRFPPKRLASGYYHLEQFKNPRATLEEEICTVAKDSFHVHTSLGAMVKLVVGVPVTWNAEEQRHSFPNAQPPTTAMVREACTRLQSFGFVGISDYWDASICLFHALNGGQMSDVEFVNVRKGNYQKVPEATKHAFCDDYADLQLYRCALAVFMKALANYSSCQSFLPDDAKPLLISM